MKKNAGFTLMELMVTIAIVAIMSAIAVPNWISWRNNMQFNSGIRMVRSAIEGAQMNAIKTNMPSRLSFIIGSGTFTVEKWDMATNAFIAPPATYQLPPGVILVDSNFAADQLQFSSRGMPTNAIGGTLKLQNDAGNLCQKIVIASSGSARIANCP